MVNSKKILSRMWTDSLTVTEDQEVTNPDGSTGYEPVIVLEGQPCKLSFSSSPSARRTDTDAPLSQFIKIFLDNDITINPGSRIIITRGDRVFEFRQSGIPAIFSGHQEIELTTVKEFA